MSLSSPAANPLSVAERPASKLLQSTSEFLIRRRILISAILFALLIARDVAYGPKPHDLTNWRDPASVAGAVLVLSGLALRSWAAGILRKDAELTTAGPYAVIRNPLYAGSFLMMIGFCVLLGDPKNLLFILVPVLIIYFVKVRQEEQLLARRFPDEWASYSRSTPRFLPRPRRVRLSARWQVSQWVRSREYQALVATLSALVAIKIWHAL
jgi:protein-S-isoprenylcysteine O-methyltransferase Ste14